MGADLIEGIASVVTTIARGVCERLPTSNYILSSGNHQPHVHTELDQIKSNFGECFPLELGSTRDYETTSLEGLVMHVISKQSEINRCSNINDNQ